MNLRHVVVESRDIPIGMIREPELPSRSSMDETKLDELTADIRAKGVLVPLIVAPVDDEYECVAGHRRWHGARRAGLAVVPCRVYPSKDSALEAVKYSENRFREDLNAAEEAIYFAQLLERDCGGDVDKLCEQLGEKRGYVEGRLLLLRGDERIFQSLEDGKIKIGVAQALNKCPDENYRRMLLHQAIVGGATASVVNGWIQDYERNQHIASGEPAPVAAPSTPAAIPETNFFTCICCRKTNDVHLMVPVNVHQHCKLAILDPMVAAYRGES